MNLSWDEFRQRWPRSAGAENSSLRSIVAHVKEGSLNLSPEYQRGRVWTDVQCSRFIGFLMEGGEAPPIWVQRWNSASEIPDEVVDGVQRITALLRFVAGEIPLETASGEIAYLTEFSEIDRRRLVSMSGPTLRIQYVSYPTTREVIEFYLRLNRGGTPHTEEEIDRVREILLRS